MIQRKQTLWLLLSLAATVLCLCMPIGSFEPSGMGTSDKMYNLWIQLSNGTHDYAVWPMFALLLVTCPITICAILLYGSRKMQGNLCLFNMLLYVLWYILLAVNAHIGGTDIIFHIHFPACLPAFSIILSFMAYKGIQHDEKLVRAADRIR